MASHDSLHRWAQEYATRLLERARELERYVELSLTLRKLDARRAETPQWLGRDEEGIPPRRILAHHLLHKDAPKRCLLLGPPGCGKTATSKFLAKRLLEQFLSGEEKRFPVLLPGHEMAIEGRSLWDHIHRSLACMTPGHEFEMIRRVAGEGKMVLLVDGYDELPRSTTTRTHFLPRSRWHKWMKPCLARLSC